MDPGCRKILWVVITEFCRCRPGGRRRVYLTEIESGGMKNGPLAYENKPPILFGSGKKNNLGGDHRGAPTPKPQECAMVRFNDRHMGASFRCLSCSIMWQYIHRIVRAPVCVTCVLRGGSKFCHIERGYDTRYYTRSAYTRSSSLWIPNGGSSEDPKHVQSSFVTPRNGLTSRTLKPNQSPWRGCLRHLCC